MKRIVMLLIPLVLVGCSPEKHRMFSIEMVDGKHLYIPGDEGTIKMDSGGRSVVKIYRFDPFECVTAFEAPSSEVKRVEPVQELYLSDGYIDFNSSGERP